MKGGKRPGAGRKPSENPKHTFSVKLTVEEEIKVKDFIIQLRKPPK